jgi:hypothetical protein
LECLDISESLLSDLFTLFVWLINQPTVLFSQNKPATSNQPAVLFSQNKSAPAISYQPNEQAAKIASPSLKRPVITLSCETPRDMLYTIEICVPRLVTPLLESMPDLLGAHVKFDSSNFDREAAENATKCFVLEGLAEAKDLVMMAYGKSTVQPKLYIYTPFNLVNYLIITISQYMCFSYYIYFYRHQ